MLGLLPIRSVPRLREKRGGRREEPRRIIVRSALPVAATCALNICSRAVVVSCRSSHPTCPHDDPPGAQSNALTPLRSWVELHFTIAYTGVELARGLHNGQFCSGGPARHL